MNEWMNMMNEWIDRSVDRSTDYFLIDLFDLEETKWSGRDNEKQRYRKTGTQKYWKLRQKEGKRWWMVSDTDLNFSNNSCGVHSACHIDGITPYIILWFPGSYYSCYYWAMVDTCMKWTDYQCGVPQGSILGPLKSLFCHSDRITPYIIIWFLAPITPATTGPWLIGTWNEQTIGVVFHKIQY